jgi:thiol-disulfide isomerase/thioredoxin
MKYYFILFFFCFGYCFVIAQEPVNIKLEKKDWDSNRKSFNIKRIKSEKSISNLDLPLRLMNGDNITQYVNFVITIQRETENFKWSFLKVLVAPNQNQQLNIVVDKNDNHNFSDDSVYTINMKDRVTSFKDFFKRLPMITIDSLKVINQKNEVEYKTINLKLGVCKLNGEHFETIDQLIKSGNYNLDIYTVEYYSGSIQTENENYEFAVALNPVTQNFSGYPGTSETDGAVFFYKSLLTKDTLLNMVPIGLWNTSNSFVKNIISIGKDTFKISALSLHQKELTLLNFPQTDNQPIELTDENIDTDFWGIINDNSYTLLDFSGSWCKPCEIILPKLKDLYSRFGSKVNFATIAIENDYFTAQKHHIKTGVSWKMTYENLNCIDDKCLKNIFGVLGYPTLVIIDNNRKIIFHEEGTEAVEKAEQLFQKLFDLKSK